MPIRKAIALKGISIYKKYISPQKGFSCPHKLVYGGVSCSTYVQHQIELNGLSKIHQIIKERGKECREAALQFSKSNNWKMDPVKNYKQEKKKDKWYNGACSDATLCELPMELISCLGD